MLRDLKVMLYRAMVEDDKKQRNSIEHSKDQSSDLSKDFQQMVLEQSEQGLPLDQHSES